LDDAALAYTEALKLDSNLAATRFNLGSLYLEQHVPEAAIPQLRAFVSLQTNHAGGWLKLGTAQLEDRQFQAAASSFSQTLRLEPNSAPAWNGLGLTLMAAKNYAEAYRYFSAAVQVDGSYAPACLNAAIVAHQHLKQPDVAIDLYGRYLDLKPSAADYASVKRVVESLQTSILPPQRPAATGEVAVAALNRATLVAPPTNAPTSDPPSAGEATQPSTISTNKLESRAPSPAAIDPPDASDPGSTNVRSQIPASELRVAQSATQIATTNPPAVQKSPPETAAAPAKTSPPESPKRQPERSARIPKPTVTQRQETRTARVQKPVVPPPAPVRNARPYGLPKMPPPPAGMLRYQYLAPLKPASGQRIEAQRVVREALQAQQRYRTERAMALYRQAIRQDPSFFEAYYNLGVAAQEQGNLRESLWAYEHALAIDPDSPRARYNFAVALEQSGYPYDAAQQYEMMVSQAPDSARLHFSLGRLYAGKLRHTQQAREHYQRVLQLESQHPQATAMRYWLDRNP
jgi:tetratricopeptide (TPR) repeat protein